MSTYPKTKDGHQYPKTNSGHQYPKTNSGHQWIFLRGLTRESRHWGDFIATFCDQVHDAEVNTLDLPGNGSLSHLPSLVRVEDMAAWCRAELSARGIRPPYHLLAMSLGAERGRPLRSKTWTYPLGVSIR